jgi:hypothetical protein
LPPRIARQLEQEAGREAAEKTRADGQRQAHHEDLHQGAMAMWRAAAELRGDVVSAVALASAQVPADPGERDRAASGAIQDVLAAKLAEMTEQDNWQKARDKAQADRDSGLIHVEFAEPVLAARTERGRFMASRRRWFDERRAARRAAAEAEAHMHDYGLLEVTPRRRDLEPAVVVGPSHRSDEELRLSYRGGVG